MKIIRVKFYYISITLVFLSCALDAPSSKKTADVTPSVQSLTTVGPLQGKTYDNRMGEQEIEKGVCAIKILRWRWTNKI